MRRSPEVAYPFAGACLLLAGLGAHALAACGSTPSTPPADAGADVSEPPSWLGDAGLVVREPAQRPLHELCGIASNPGDMPLGDDAASAVLRKGYFDAAVDLGGVMIRRDFRWAQIEPRKGAFDFTQYDRLVDEAGQRGVRLLGSLGYGVPWANQAATDEFFPPTDPADFAAYAAKTVERYRGRVAAWELWNEPNNGFRFWKPSFSGDAVAYAALLSATYPAVHGADPGARLLLGGTVFTAQLIQGGIPWLEQAYAAQPDLAQRFDVAGVHTYAAYPPQREPEIGELNDPPIEAKLQMHAWLLAKHGGASKPMWITELGWPVYGRVDESVQAHFTVRATILAALAGAEGIFWYTLRDGPEPLAFPPEDAFGLLHQAQAGSTPKPVYVALKTLLARVGERWPTRDAAPLGGLPTDARAVVFRGASGPAVVAAWTVTTPSAEATWGGEGADAFGELGDARGTLAKGARVTLGPAVTYIALH
jgi:hypothetical protein